MGVRYLAERRTRCVGMPIGHVLGLCLILGTLNFHFSEAGVVLERYGPIDVNDKVLLKQRTEEIVKSKGFAACIEWLHADIKKTVGGALAGPELSARLADARTALEQGDYKFVVKGNYALAESEFRDRGNRLLAKFWWVRNGAWQIYRVDGLEPSTPSPFIVEKDDFLERNPLLPALVGELRIFDELSTEDDGSAPLLIVTSESSLREVPDRLQFVRYVAPKDMPTWRERELDALRKEYRVCELRVREIESLGRIARAWYNILGYPTGMVGDAERTHNAFAFFQRTATGKWVVTKLHDRSIFSDGE